MKNLDFEVRIPEEVNDLLIHEEFFYLKQNGEERQIKLHDYPEMYRIPYLYQYMMERLQYQSHTVLSTLLINQVTQAGGNVEDLIVLEVGAGSGMVGKALVDLGVKSITGIDIVPEAVEAAQREYPGVYENYYVEDLMNLTETTQNALTKRGFNCMVCGSALGFNHIPAEAWAQAFNVITPNGWVAFNVQKELWEDKSEAYFLAWHSWVEEKHLFKMTQMHDYQHRLYLDGRPLDFVAIIAAKQGNIS